MILRLPSSRRPSRSGDWRTARELVERHRASARTIVFTNGVFDLLHLGHLRYLQDARKLGDALIVGLNSDRSVQEIKGAGRPVTPEAERAEILEALACVDASRRFSQEATPHELIQALQPDVLVKGADWAADDIVGRDVVEARGGRVVRIATRAGLLDYGDRREDQSDTSTSAALTGRPTRCGFATL